jgi:hypothetical protein
MGSTARPPRSVRGQRSLAPRKPALHAARNEAHERQAEQRGALFARGGTGLSHGLTSAPTAGFVLPASVGEPLPLGLRESLEAAFDARLSAVRLYRDAPARAAVRFQGALAFASGTDIYFGQGAYAPDRESGRELIAHEMAHVLQQTGRRSFGDTLAAQPQRGVGDVQYALDFESLRALHGGKTPSTSFQQRADEIKAASVDKDTLAAYAEKHWNELATWPADATGLLYDQCKLLGLPELAARMIERDNFKGGLALRTAYYDADVADQLAKRSTGVWVHQRAIEEIPDLKLYRSELVRLIEGYLFQRALEKPTPLVRNADPAAGEKSTKWQSIADHVESIRLAYGVATEPLPNEWYYHGLQYLNFLNRKRLDFAVSEREAGATWSPHESRRRFHRIGSVRRLAENIRGISLVDDKKEVDKVLSERWQPFNQKLADEIVAVADKAQARWDALEALSGQMLDPKTNGQPSAGQLQAIVTLATSSNLSTRLAQAMRALNASEKDGSRMPADYASLAMKHAAAVDLVLKQQIDAKLQLWHRKGQTEQLLAGMWLIANVWPVRDLLFWEQEPFGHEQGAQADVQVQVDSPRNTIAHRIAVAREMARLAPVLRSDELAKQAAAVLTAELESDSQLALLPDKDGVLWRQDTVSEDKVMDDFSNVPLRGPEPTTPYAWLLLYQATYLERMKTELDKQLPADEAGEKRMVGQGVQPSIVGTASTTVREGMKKDGLTPQRWTVPEDGKHVYFARKEGGTDFYTALMHEVYPESFYADAIKLNLEAIAPIFDHGKAFVWFWPKYPTLLKLLRQITLYDELVAMARFGAKDEASLKLTRALADAEWSKQLGEVMHVKLDPEGSAETRFSAAELKAVVDAVNAFFKQYRDTKEAALGDDFMRATRIDRMRWAGYARAQLKLYDEQHLRTGLRDDVFERVQRFYLSLLVVFNEDAAPAQPGLLSPEVNVAVNGRPRLHLGALLLEIAPEMESAFEYERSSAFIVTYLGLLEDGLVSAQVLASLPASDRAAYLHSDENDDGWLGKQLTALKTVVERFRAQREAVQLEAGFTASVKDQTLDVQMRFSSVMPQNTDIYPRSGYGVLGADLTGKYYRFLGVQSDFVYHPAFGGEQPQTMRSTRSGYAAPKILQLDNKTPLANGTLLLSIVETDSKGAPLGVPFDLRNDPADYAKLAEIYSGALYWAFGSSMKNIREGMERYVSTMADLAELIPGWGTAITAARVLETIAEFWVSGAYEDMLRVINGDTREMLEGLFKALSDLADPGAVVELLLFGNPVLNRLLASSTVVSAAKSDEMVAKRPADARGKFSGLKRTFAALKALGRRFAKGLEGLHERVQQPMQDARIYTSTRPALSMALQFAASHIYEIKELMTASAAIFAMVDDQERAADPSVADKFRSLLGSEQAELGEKIHGVVDRLATLELPHTVVDVTGAVQFIQAEMMSFTGKRLGLQGKVVTIILEGSGAIDYFTSKVAHELVGRGFDPNVYWRDDVIPLISDKFNAARDSLVQDLNDLLAKPAFDKMFTPIGKGAPVALEPDASVTYPDDGVQPAPAADRELVPHPKQLPRATAGSPLPDDARGDLEAGFGSDLRHVRVHTGGDGEAMTSAFGADALASGSHVFMREGLDPARGRGEEVMRHELAHVVQQTGPRAPDAPQPARPERGLMVDPASESQAQQLATAVRGQLGSSPSGGGAGEGAGMQPYTLEKLDPYLLARSLRALNRLSEIKTQEEKYDKAKTPAKLERSGDTDAVGALVKAFSSVTKKSSTLVVKAPKVFLGNIDAGASSAMTMDKILAELDKNLDVAQLGIVASHIAQEAQDLIPQVKTPGSKKPKPQQRFVNPSHFARQFEGYVLGKTGVALSLGIKTRDFIAPDGSTLKEIDPTAPLGSFDVLHVYLPYVAANSDLSVKAITNTWPDAITDDKRRAKLSATVRGTLQGKGIRAAVWALFGDAYKFSIIFKKEIENTMAASMGGTLDPNLLPPPDDYADADLSQKQASRVGTRVATYGDANQTADGRHSHHLTQFLVAQYFANKNDGKQPFVANAKLPGVTWTGGVVTRISPNPTQPDAGIKVGETYDGDRGLAMPAISLAASTHLGGDLHITQEPDDLGHSTKKTQSHAVDTTFRSGLPEPLKAEKYATQYAAWRKGKTDADIAQIIYDRAQVTFRTWAKHMNNQLVANMPRMELEYYKFLATANTTSAAVKTVSTDAAAQAKLLDRLQKVAGLAVSQNYKVMDSLGWKEA